MAGLGVQELREFAEKCLQQLQGVLATLNWSLPGGVGEIERASCSYDANHQMQEAVLGNHVASCRLRQLGYSKEETDVLYDPNFFYGKTQLPTAVIDQALQTQIIRRARERASHERGSAYNESSYSSVPVEVPQNHKHAVCDLTPADRLAIYDYVLEETKKQRSSAQVTENDSDLFEDLAAKVNQEDGQKGPKSHLEILAEMRDYKRRRQSYRAKNVHITKKSYTEVIRDVIGVHMEELTSHWQEEDGPDAQEGTSHFTSARSARKEARRSASLDSRHSGGSHRETDYSKRRREHSRSPHKRKRSRSTDRDSRRKRKRDEERRHSNKTRK
ncbi:U11/U12 small nuclear ribonucleoprotein 48 kDa protein [Microcaecilia unicolor]|uniref:U11/U12 small nuclear ribonucleoprotein 48 kDa protein n=1 Tax=Microcaecilia unicolor TaxID=1415580 RepID=A0A6P7YII6_9AMPH|nr:U11/U12 small nuclear ribonucleoprotein 48 kDa protein [Microcaecilia unicolor]XP_030064716.1 U11/U12 small nuclear ribonucleoprotein 48 kDa protein [Microcaecilia unicolor]XP_030064723.1 U11/U12 small nuclear ribonucleoprotein 48 kDa protein [Microcaecilia unicolor]